MEDKPTLLIVEDDLDVAEMLEAYFRVQGYNVLTVNWGEDAIERSVEHTPDLIILDIRLPDIDGFEVARRLRKNRRTELIPIIFLTEKRTRNDRLHGLELGADDYITKPFDIQELRLRVRNSLERVRHAAVHNPVTGFPEGDLVDEHLSGCLEKDDWALLSISLRNLDAFRDAYGFVASDDVLRAIGLMVNNAVRALGGEGDFIGHLAEAHFVVLTTPDRLVTVGERIRNRIEQSLDYFYPLKDRVVEIPSDRRLALKMRALLPKDGPFASLDVLKKTLLSFQ